VAAIDQLFPRFLPHLLVAVHTGMRMTEQYSLRWSQVNLERRQLHLPKTNPHKPRVISLNDTAMGAFNSLKATSTHQAISYFRLLAPGNPFKAPVVGLAQRWRKPR